MASAEKLLAAMLADEDPRGYTYSDATRVLRSVGFAPARTKPKGSHRLWRLEVANAGDKRSIYVSLVEAGHGTLKPVYIRTMLETLLQYGLARRQD